MDSESTIAYYNQDIVKKLRLAALHALLGGRSGRPKSCVAFSLRFEAQNQELYKLQISVAGGCMF